MSLDLRNIKLIIGYDGTEFSGWQRQLHVKTIQGELERHLARITREEINLHGAGRTDAGVHAEAMVANFFTRTTISCPIFLRGLNSMLPGAIKVFNAEEVELNFHARFSAKGKRYQYTLYNGNIQPPQLRLYSVHVTGELNLPAMKNCLQLLEGTHDFSSFENSGSRDKSICSGRGAVRTIYQARLHEHPPSQLVFQFTGDGFLRNMIRNFMGTLLEVGRGKISTEAFVTILQAKNRAMAATTAPAHGLSLKEVFYEDLSLI